ncbi:MAG: NUDIX domain-containing protein [Acidobacteriota bacterium]|nr:NUDIX domain-containing protein [Acidobacteriota bacterium]
MTTLDTEKPQAAVAIVRARNADSILLMRRTEREEDPWSGNWAYPGGRAEEFDASPLHTALRELQEECGVALDEACLHRALRPLPARRRRPPYLVVAPFLLHVENELPTVVDPEEAVEASWMPLREWRDPLRHQLRTVPNMPRNCLFPAIDWHAHPVWGFTYRLTTDWLGLMAAHHPREAPGKAAAERALEFLLAHGLRLKSDWQASTVPALDPMLRTAQVALVEGEIPSEAVLARCAEAAPEFPAINMIEVQPDLVRIIGLGFEEYVIRAE